MNIKRIVVAVLSSSIIVLAFSALGADAPASPAKRTPFLAKPFLIGVHRGGRALRPENTVEAYTHAAATWPDVLLEGDARLTKDGQVVLLHDADVDRTTNGTGSVASMTLAQIKELDAGYRFTPDNGNVFPYRGKGLTIPTLAEALVAAPQSRFLIELKPQPGIADAVARVLKEAHAEDRVAVASFIPAYMEQIRKEIPTLTCCYDLVEGTQLLWNLRQGDWNAYKPTADILAVDTEFIETLHITMDDLRAIQRKGIAVLVHTINDPKAMREFLDAGMDCILTDNPGLLAELIAQAPR